MAFSAKARLKNCVDPVPDLIRPAREHEPGIELCQPTGFFFAHFFCSSFVPMIDLGTPIQPLQTLTETSTLASFRHPPAIRGICNRRVPVNEISSHWKFANEACG